MSLMWSPDDDYRLDESYGKKTFYRFDDSLWADGTMLNETKFYEVRETKCGYWVRHEFDFRGEDLKFVLKSGRKRLCYPTRAEALLSFMHRKRVRASILNSQLNKNKRMADIANKMAIELGVSFKEKNENFSTTQDKKDL